MATFLTDRHEIAKAINIHRYPSVVFDVTKPYEDYEGYYKTDACFNLVVPYKARNTDLRYEADLFIEIPREREDKSVTITDMAYKVKLGSAGCCCIKDSFGPNDVFDMVAKRSLQDVHAGDIIVIVFKTVDGCIVELMKISDRVDPHCTTMAILEEVDVNKIDW